MINLAGNKDADKHIKEELYLAGVEQVPAIAMGEVPYTIEGRVGHWKLKRAWYYWVATVELRSDGLKLKDALELHNKPNPINPNKNLGQSIRSGGDAGCPSPNGYTAQPIYDEALEEKLMALGYEQVYSDILKRKYVPISMGDMGLLCTEGKLDVERYVDCYHIDDQIGLLEFAKTIKNLK